MKTAVIFIPYLYNWDKQRNINWNVHISKAE